MLGIAGVLALIAVALMNIAPDNSGRWSAPVNNFDECVAAGNPVMESYPRQCMDGSGKTFVEDIQRNNLQASSTSSYDECGMENCGLIDENIKIEAVTF